MPDVRTTVDLHRQRILAIVPEAEVFLSGSASVPGLPANDIDLVAVVTDVEAAAARLAEAYSPLYQDEWRDDWAAFRDPGPPQVDIVVTQPGSSGEAHHRRAWQLLARDARLLDEYRALKADTAGYEQRKAAFFERVVALLD